MIIPQSRENLEKNVKVELQLLDTNISNYEVKSKILSTRINSKNSNNNSYAFYSLDDYSTKLNSYISSLYNLKNILNELLSICQNNINDEQIDGKINYYNEQNAIVEKENVTFLSKIDTFVYSSMKSYRSDLNLSNYNISKKSEDTTDNTTTEATIKLETIPSAILEETQNIVTPEVNSEEIINTTNTEPIGDTQVETNLGTIEPINELNQAEVQGNIKQTLVSEEPIIEENAPKVLTDNNTLIISEIQGKVFLPYQISELEKTLAESKVYNTLEDVISDLYVIPIEKYKFSNKARFKETYELMRKREKASIFESLNIAFEQTFNRSLNPAIITACKNLGELDIYLDCLDDNETSKFPCFKIEYEILPQK